MRCNSVYSTIAKLNGDLRAMLQGYYFHLEITPVIDASKN